MNRQLYGQMLTGGILVVVGILLTLMNMDLIEPLPLWRYWPSILILVGLVKFFTSSGRRRRLDGYWWLVFGSWFQVSIVRVWGLGFGDTWPMLIVAWGVSLLLERPPKVQHAHSGNS